ncbi:magnesium and cobalt transport protein CorA [Antrihabitans cavernicola]|uniref:Magnesium and cobalt transport protein CorA n=2 Tax=Antrihabitans cavernicola TaxID=2495913 RepID=A0A5A7SG54_9NOCA|nr:magnesium and cobalt transport protein CorA [Spelaeibacter cavernicola]KAA0024806.1 magnesium and cobalt transport protein CorA [Spelaeibacter cavernicola]
MIIDCALYKNGQRQHEERMPLEDAARRCTEGGFVWLGMFEPDQAELEEVRVAFGLHELAVEDAQSFHLRPKVEQYGDDDFHLVILRTARYDNGSVDFGEISVFIGSNFVITVRQGVASELHGARERLEQRPKLLALGTQSVLWAILDQVIDSYTPVVADLEHDIDAVEAMVFSGAVAPTERIYFLRREVTDFWRAVHPLLAATAIIERGRWADELTPYFRDVNDHLVLVNEEVSAQRDLLATILEANMAVISVEQTKVSVRQSAFMEQLTIMSTVFLPLTFVTGFFGQNFGWLVDNIASPWEFVLFGIGGLLLPCMALYMWFRAKTAKRKLEEQATAIAQGRGSSPSIPSRAKPA